MCVFVGGKRDRHADLNRKQTKQHKVCAICEKKDRRKTHPGWWASRRGTPGTQSSAVVVDVVGVVVGRCTRVSVSWLGCVFWGWGSGAVVALLR